jgi:hypothetical protein
VLRGFTVRPPANVRREVEGVKDVAGLHVGGEMEFGDKPDIAALSCTGTFLQFGLVLLEVTPNVNTPLTNNVV